MTVREYSEVTKNFSNIAVSVFNGNLEIISRCHPALTKAIRYMSEHYREEISLDTVSNYAYCSPSHLAFLFRNHLGMRFKGLLVQLRLQHAIALMDRHPEMSITDLALESGFGDLAHFEKMFRRYTGRSARMVRRLIREQKQTL